MLLNYHVVSIPGSQSADSSECFACIVVDSCANDRTDSYARYQGKRTRYESLRAQSRSTCHTEALFVRRTFQYDVHALSHRLEPDLKEQLIDILDYLLADRTTVIICFVEVLHHRGEIVQLVVGSAMYAFTEVCPDRMQLMHKHFRKICAILIDVDEWGQVLIVNTLTRYARENFPNPNEEEEEEQVKQNKVIALHQHNVSSGEEA